MTDDIIITINRRSSVVVRYQVRIVKQQVAMQT
jgi:hypothetical protein